MTSYSEYVQGTGPAEIVEDPPTSGYPTVVSAILAGLACGEAELPVEDEDERIIPGSLIRDLLDGVYGQLRDPKIRLNGFVITGDVDLSYSKWRGELDLSYCRISGAVNLAHSSIEGVIRLDGAIVHSLDASYADVNGPLQFRDGQCLQGMYLLGVRISGSFNINRTKVWAPVDRPNRCAVELYRARIGDVFFSRAELYGGVYAHALTSDRNVRLRETTIVSRNKLGLETGVDSDDVAVGLVGASISGALYISWKDDTRPSWTVNGRVALTRLSCTTLRVRASDLLRDDIELKVDGLTYSRLASSTPEEWLSVLQSTPAVPSQPYIFLADYCRQHGRSDLARRVLVSLQRRITSELPWRSIERWRRQFLAWSIEYGYRPGRALLWLLVCTGLCTVILAVGGDFLLHQTSASTPDRGVKSWTDAITTSLDNVLPFAGLGVTKQWSASPQNAWQVVWLVLFVGIKFLGWGMAAMGLASVTGLMRKE
jgi:hypothetical protein